MPICDVLCIGDDDGATAEPSGRAAALADALGAVWPSPPGRVWVRLQLMAASAYAENGGAVDPSALPVFVTLTLARWPEADRLAAEIRAVAQAVAGCIGRDVERVHVELAPPAAGRMAFGGELATASSPSRPPREPAPVSVIACGSPEHPGWLDLRRQLWPHHDAATLQAEMVAYCREPQRYAQFIATSDQGDALGFVEVPLRRDYVNGTTHSPVGFLEGIYVVPGARRQGLARALVGQAMRWARQQGCRELASDALIDNAASHAMHRALGFEQTQKVVFFRRSLDGA